MTSVRLHRLLALFLTAVLLLAALPGLSVGRSAKAQDWSPPSTVYLERTGHTLDRMFLDMWRQHGSVLGDPITEEMSIETPYSDGKAPVQFFENAALVYLSGAAPGEQVRLLPLGRTMALATRKDQPNAFRPVGATDCRGDGCQLVVRTRHTVEGDTLDLWQSEDGQLLGAPISQPFKDGKQTVQYFENGAVETTRDGVQAMPIGSAVAKDEGYKTDRIDRPADVPAYDTALFEEPALVADDGQPTAGDDQSVASDDQSVAGDTGADQSAATDEPVVASAVVGPGPQQGGAKEIVVSISASSMWAYDNGELFISSLVSTGIGAIPETVTPTGYFSILSKYDVQTMTGNLGGEDYNVPDVPWVMYFDDLGNALHGAYWHNNFGTPMSHGCVNLPMDVAPVLYAWADIGTPVTVLP
jgi:hypothetical protein